MPFTIDPKLIENDEARLEENSSGNLEIVHVPTGTTLEIDSGGAVSTFGKTNEEIQDAVGGIVTNGLVYDDAANTISISQGSGSGLNADTVDGIEAANLGSVNEATSEYNLSDDNSNKIFAVDKSSGNLDITGTVTENSSL